MFPFLFHTELHPLPNSSSRLSPTVHVMLLFVGFFCGVIHLMCINLGATFHLKKVDQEQRKASLFFTFHPSILSSSALAGEEERHTRSLLRK